MTDQLDDLYMNRIKASMIDSFTDFISIANTDRKIIYFNPAAYRLMGYEPWERPEITTTAQLHAEGFEDFARDYIQPSVFENGWWTGISRIRHKDGSDISVEMTVFPLYGPAGEEYGTVAVMRDVSELTRVNEKLQKSSLLFQKVLDSARIGIVLINMETHTIEMVNQCTADMLMLPVSDIIGHKCFDVLCHRSLELCPYQDGASDNLVTERYLQRSDGSSMPILKTGTHITIDAKHFLVDTFVDITIQKELEKSLSDAKLAAEAASRSKSEFLSRMSHEMRTPLNAIIGMAQITEKTEDVRKLKECIETIKISSNHLLNLINDVLDLSKIEEGKLELTVSAFSLPSMMRKISMLIEPKALDKCIRFSTVVDPALPPFFMGDSLRITQVLLNFLSNAVKFTPENGRINCTVDLLDNSDGVCKLRFCVEDSGIGITEDQLARLFSPFTQADGSITRKYGGTGLGLVISRRMINLMGSDVEVKTAPGQGSAFSFELLLPIATAIESTDDEITPNNVAGLFKDKRVLVVDDVEVNRIVIMELLSDTGVECVEACDGAQAVELAGRSPFDIILMDIQMPMMDGFEATRQIRALEKPFAGVPIVAMSANVYKEDIDRCLAAGMDGHIGKPVDFGDLIRIMGRHLSKRESTLESGRPVRFVSFRPDVAGYSCDRNYFNFNYALLQYDNDRIALAQACDEFINDTLFASFKEAFSQRDKQKSVRALRLIMQTASQLGFTCIASYAGNVCECLEVENYDFASTYLLDLEKCYRKTVELISDLLQVGGG